MDSRISIVKKREELNECFEFCELELKFHGVITHGTRHVPTRWLGFPADDCPAAIHTLFISFGPERRNDKTSDDEHAIQELYLYFSHFFTSIQDTVLKLENRSTVSYDLSINQSIN